MSIDRITKLGELMEMQQAEVDELEARLKQAKAALARTQTEDLPAMMDEIGLQEFRLQSGYRISIKDDVKCGITAATRDRAHKWLLEHGFGGLIKTSVELLFGRGEVEAAHELARRLHNEHPDLDVKEVVHPSTLKAFINEQLAEGKNVPADLFNLHPYRKAVITKG